MFGLKRTVFVTFEIVLYRKSIDNDNNFVIR